MYSNKYFALKMRKSGEYPESYFSNSFFLDFNCKFENLTEESDEEGDYLKILFL